MAVENL